jgi:hypothetical protein
MVRDGEVDILEEDLLALVVGADGLLVEVDEGRAGDGVGDHERGRSQVVGAHERVDAALKVPVARKHARSDQVALL